ncbi:hypothetical protein [Pyruvatibacter sp.]
MCGGCAQSQLYGADRVIRYDGGGDIQEYIGRVTEKQTVALDGDCYSACTIWLDRARHNPDQSVCITPYAEFHFHLGFRYSKINGEWEFLRRFDTTPLYHSEDIAEWIAAHGGPPADGWLTMTYEDARAYWPTCT